MKIQVFARDGLIAPFAKHLIAALRPPPINARLLQDCHRVEFPASAPRFERRGGGEPGANIAPKMFFDSFGLPFRG